MSIGETTKGTPSRNGRSGKPQVKVGKVVSDKMDKTVLVEVQGSTTHRLYHRQVKRTTKFAAHDEKNEAKIGDRVAITETRPVSRRKRWVVTSIVEKAKEI